MTNLPDTINDSLISIQAGQIVFPLGVPAGQPIPPAKALRLAAWVVALADPSPGHADFRALLDAVERT